MGLFSSGSIDICDIEFRVDVCKKYHVKDEVEQLLRLIKESDRNSQEFIKQYDKIKVIMQQAVFHDEFKVLKKLSKELKEDYKYLLGVLTEEDIKENSSVFTKAGYTASYVFGSDDWIDNIVKRFALNGFLYKEAKGANIKLTDSYAQIFQNYYGWALTGISPLQGFNDLTGLNIVLEDKSLLNWLNFILKDIKVGTKAVVQAGAVRAIQTTADITGIDITIHSLQNIETHKQRRNREFREITDRCQVARVGDYFVTWEDGNVNVGVIQSELEDGSVIYEQNGELKKRDKDHRPCKIAENTYNEFIEGDTVWVKFRQNKTDLIKGKVKGVSNDLVFIIGETGQVRLCKAEDIVYVCTDRVPVNAVEIITKNIDEIYHFNEPTPEMIATVAERDIVFGLKIMGVDLYSDNDEWKAALNKIPEEKLLAIIRVNPSLMSFIEQPTRSNVCKAVVKGQPANVCLYVVTFYGLALEFVEEQTPEICKAAVKQNKDALKFVKPEFMSLFENWSTAAQQFAM